MIGATNSSYLGVTLSSMGLGKSGEKGLVQKIMRINGVYSIVSVYYGDNFTLMVTQSLVNSYKNVWGTIIVLFLFVFVTGVTINSLIVIYNNKLTKERDERLRENEKKNRELSGA